MTIDIIFKLLGALALLIYGMKLMSEALQKMAGPQLRHVLGAVTANRFTGVFTGMFVTSAVQSSSATTVMTVSFVNAGLLTLAQAISIIMGANIGTTLTAWIMSLGYNVDLTNVVFPAFMVGMFLIYRKKHRYLGDFLFGMAFMFFSLVMLSTAGREMDLGNNEAVVEFFSSFDTGSYLSVLAFLAIGTLITGSVQSSAAVMAMTILLCSTGVLPIYFGIALVLGENIGTTMTANAAAFGANTQARRAAMAHLLFNVFGVVWVMLVFYPFVDMICRIVGYDPTMKGQTEKLPVLLAMFHTFFNIINTALLLGFIPQIEKACRWLIKPKETKEKEKTRLRFIEKGLMVAPEISVLQAQREVTLFAERMQRMFGMVRSLVDEKDKKEVANLYERIEKYENIADNMEIEIATYLEEVGKAHLSDSTKGKIRSMLRQISELESIGDACFSLARILRRKHEGKEDFTADQYEHLHEMLRLANESLAQMIVVVGGRRENQTLDLSEEIEKDINALRDNLRTEHIQAVNAHQYSYMIGTIYVDIINACEKLGDYVMNVVEARLGKGTLGYRGLKMNLDRKIVTIDGDDLVLTRTEFNLLHLLLANRGQIFSRQQLMETIWSDVVVSDRTVDVNIARLRKKLGPYAQNIANRQGFGYYFDGE